jgi:hypothetical protein
MAGGNGADASANHFADVASQRLCFREVQVQVIGQMGLGAAEAD